MENASREEQKSRTRKKILEVAKDLFALNGLISTSSRDIAKSANVSNGLIFSYFPTTEDLYQAVIEDFGVKISGRILELTKGEESLKDILNAHLVAISENEDFYTRLVVENTLLSNSCRSSFVNMQSSISHMITESAKGEIETGKIKEMPLHMLFNAWVGLVNHYLINRDLFALGESVIAKRGNEILDFFMTMIEKKGEKL